MTPLTKEQVEKLRPAESVPNSAAEMRYADDIRGLCDLALSAISQESVRSEAAWRIEELAKEQPGEQIAAPQGVTSDTAGQPGAYLTAVAAPDEGVRGRFKQT